MIRLRSTRRSPRLLHSPSMLRLAGLAMLGVAATSAHAQSLPTHGSVTSGGATITTSGQTLTINQTSQQAAINWQSFSIGADNAVVFVQPNSDSVALNRVLGPDPSMILGGLQANGKVFLVNPNGILFGKDASVNVGGLVASTLGLSDSDFLAGRYAFTGSGGSVVNQGAINADGGYVALLGASVSNQGTIQANLGMVALASGEAITLDVAGDGLLNLAIDKGAVNALVENGGLLRANGGQVLLTAQAVGSLLRTVVNNSGIIEARTLNNRSGTIKLLGDMSNGTMSIDGTLDASAPDGGNGGFIETSAANVKISDGVHITTASALGTTGTWLIDPKDFIIGLGGDISGSALSAQLVTTNVTISTIPSAGDGTGGAGDIYVNDAIAWVASGTPTTLTLNSLRDVNINAAISATKGNLVVCCGRDVNVNAPVTTVNGSILLNAGRDVKVFFAITTTDGNIVLCAGRDIHIAAAMTLTRGSTIPAEALGLPVGLTLIAGSSGQGPGAGGGTLIFAPTAPPTTVTVAPVNIAYNPVSYSAPTDYSTEFVLTEGATVTQRMLLFPDAQKVFDGTDTAALNGFSTTATSGSPIGVSLVAGPDATATFDSSAVGTDVGITYAGYTLSGANADQYALAAPCCTAGFRTTGTISAVAGPPVVFPPPVVVPPPVVIPPVITPPVVTPPVLLPIIPTVTPPPVAPTPVPAPGSSVTTPGLGAVPGLALAVIDGGIRMPMVEVAAAPTEEDRPIRRVGSAPGRNAFVPTTPSPKPVVPVYPPKQARH